MHVPKTSGISLTSGLIQALAPRRTVTGFDRVLCGAFSDYASLSPEVRRQIVDDPGQLPQGVPFIHGHYALSTTVRAYPQAQFMTVLREPAVRLLSMWRFWRMQTEASMTGWGSWADYVFRARRPFEVFLEDEAIAHATDNFAVRMLLLPHELIDDTAFIDPRHDETLLADAASCLERFQFLDVVEDPALPERLGRWLGRPFAYPVLNRTSARPDGTELPLHRELTSRSFDLIEARSRLDQVLWQGLVRELMPGEDVGRLRERVLVRAVARHAMASAA